MGDLRRSATGTFDDTTLVTMETLVDALAFWAEDGDDTPLREVVQPAERALVSLPRVTIAPNAAREVAQGAPVYAPGVLDVRPAERDKIGSTDDDHGGVNEDDDEDVCEKVHEGVVKGDLVACYTPNGAAVCLGRLVGDPEAEEGTVVSLERVLV